MLPRPYIYIYIYIYINIYIYIYIYIYINIYIYILKCSVESRTTVLNTWEVELCKVIAEDGKLNMAGSEVKRFVEVA